MWSFALDQRCFGPRQLVVVTARTDGGLLGLAHCQQSGSHEVDLKCCLGALDDGAAAVVAYSDEPVCLEPTPDLRQRFDTARRTANKFGVHLVDWIMCDDINFRSMKISLEDPQEDSGRDADDWWDVPAP